MFKHVRYTFLVKKKPWFQSFMKKDILGGKRGGGILPPLRPWKIKKNAFPWWLKTNKIFIKPSYLFYLNNMLNNLYELKKLFETSGQIFQSIINVYFIFSFQWQTYLGNTGLFWVHAFVLFTRNYVKSMVGTSFT